MLLNLLLGTHSLWTSYMCATEERVMEGFMWELLLFMKERMNFNFTLVHSVDGLWGGSCHGQNNCSGMIGMVNRQEVDFALGRVLYDYSDTHCKRVLYRGKLLSVKLAAQMVLFV